MRRNLVVTILLLMLLPGCGDTPRQFNPLPAALGDLRGIALGFERLKPLAPEEGTYALWLNLENRDVIAMGPFNVDSNGLPINSDGERIERFTSSENLFSSVSVLITIAPGGVGERPGQSAIMQGPFIDGVAQLSVPAPLFIDQAEGSYRVFTPTNGPDTDEGSGVWGVDVDDTPLLQLPPLNNIYSWEHYMVINDQVLTMGRFRSPILPDFNNPWSGPLPAPEFPGEDFLANTPPGVELPADLSGARLLLTLEPVLDDTIGPSQLVVLETIMPAGLQGGEIVQLTNQVANFPTGTAVIF